MTSKPVMILALASVIAMGLASASAVISTAESAEPMSEKQADSPRYSETCAHGHNGFDCKEPSYRVDITDLQKRVTALENSMSGP